MSLILVTRYEAAAVEPRLGGRIALGGEDGSVYVHSPDGGTDTLLAKCSASICSLVWSSSQNMLVVADWNDVVSFVSVDEGEIVRKLWLGKPEDRSRWSAPRPPRIAIALSISFDGRTVVAANDATIVLDVLSGEAVAVWGTPYGGGLISPEGTRVACWGDFPELIEVRWIDGCPAGLWGTFEPSSYGAAWAPTGDHIAVGVYSKYSQLAGEWIQLARDGGWGPCLVEGESEFERCVFSPDGALLAWGTRDNVVGFTLVSDGCNYPLMKMESRLIAIGFRGPDDLCAVTADGAVAQWRLSDVLAPRRRESLTFLRPPDLARLWFPPYEFDDARFLSPPCRRSPSLPGRG